MNHLQAESRIQQVIFLHVIPVRIIVPCPEENCPLENYPSEKYLSSRKIPPGKMAPQKLFY